MITFKPIGRGWEHATISGVRQTGVSDTVIAQLRLIEAGLPCQCCHGAYGDARIVRRGTRWCLYCARHDAIDQRQARQARNHEER